MSLLLGERLKSLRKATCVNQDTLAKSLNVTRSAVSFYEQGQKMPSLDVLEKLADFFQVSVDYLLARDINTNMDTVKSVTILEHKQSMVNQLNAFLENTEITVNDKKKFVKEIVDLYWQWDMKN